MLDVWDEMRGLERRLDDLFGTMARPSGWLTFLAVPPGVRAPFFPAVDVFARDGDLVVRAEIPGIDPEKEVSVTLEDGELIVRGERKRSEEIEEKDFFRAELSYGAFERHIPVPEGTTEEDVEPRYEDGVLEVVVKKAAELTAPAPKTIPVHTVKAEKKAQAA